MADKNDNAYLATVDATSGKTATLLSYSLSNYTADEGSAVVGPGGVIYSALYTSNHDDDGGAVWAVTQTSPTPGGTVVPLPASKFPWIQGLAFV